MTEFKILKYFLENKNQVLTPESDPGGGVGPGRKVCKPQYPSGKYRKAEKENRGRPPPDQDLLKTIHGIGYIWEERL